MPLSTIRPPLAISLVMPALNAAAHIGDALESAAPQMAQGDEVVLADGGSIDDTVAIAQKYSFVRVLDGTDNNLYEGFNRGIAAAKGDIIGFLNADDCLKDNALSSVLQAFGTSHNEKQATPDYISGNVSWGEGCSMGLSEDLKEGCHKNAINIEGLLFGIPAINGRFFKKSLLQDMAGFSPKAGIAADRELLLRLVTLGAKGQYLNKPLYHYRIHSGSKTIAGDHTAQKTVWNAELDLADYILSHNILGEEAQKWVKRSRALIHFKQSLTGASKLSIRDLAHLPHALLSWRIWRARLSGY